MLKVALGLLLGVLATTAVAEEISAATDRLLWCGSAFYWLSTDAYDSGDTVEGDQYEAWSNDLGARADMMLESEGKGEDEIGTIREDYDTRVVAEMGQPGAKYDVTTCPDLVAAP
ncbi:hypothetical protein PRN20_02610 [Devosia sp. ZB163]|uniref:hypothetical protein n=1 Tax=Devosia sp. ZB163 TaxID=3025938 RepID=UPI00235F6F28|nr:hypothetical protein [Devosia sp. ZB163]MDC9822614.1 hypothetical protein [Devosia sp. ZB163]